MPRIKMSLSIGVSNAKQVDYYDFDDAQWEAMSDFQREEVLEQLANDHGSNYIDLAAWVVEDDSDE